MRTIINDGECIKRYMNVWGNLFASCCIAYPTLQRTPFPFHPHLFVYYNRDTIRVKTLLNRQHQGFQIASNPSIFRRSFDKRILFSSPNDNTPLSFSHALYPTLFSGSFLCPRPTSSSFSSSFSSFILSFSPRVADEKNVIKGARSRGPLTLAHTLAHACTHRCVYVYNESGWQPAAWPLRVNDARRPRRCRNVCAVAVVTCTRTQQPRLLSAS